MFERFTDRARRVVVLSQEEARMFNHEEISTGHLLLGLIHEGEGGAARALESCGLSLELLRQRLEEERGRGEVAPERHIPFTAEAKNALEKALPEASVLGHNYIATEHLLLGLLCTTKRDDSTVFCKLLERSELKPETVWRHVMDTLSPGRYKSGGVQLPDDSDEAIVADPHDEPAVLAELELSELRKLCDISADIVEGLAVLTELPLRALPQKLDDLSGQAEELRRLLVAKLTD